MYKSVLEKAQKEASGTNAKNIVADITRFHRIPASPGFRQAAEYCERWFKENGLASVEILEAEIRELAQKELDRFKATTERYRLSWNLKKVPVSRKPRLTATEKKAATIVPKRIYRGPISMRLALERMSDEQRRTYRKEMERKKKSRNTLDPAIYWSNGKRILLEIAKLVRQEVGQMDLKFLLGHFETLEKHGLIKIERVS